MDTRLKIVTASSISAVVIAALALTMAPAGAAHNVFWNSDGFDAESSVEATYVKKNNAHVNNTTSQTAVTGDVDVAKVDDYEGNAGTGSAGNGSTTNTGIAATISSPAIPSVATFELSDATSLEEWDDVWLSNSVDTFVKSENSAAVNNTTSQTAVSGSVDVHYSDDVTGGATTGNASNASSTTTSITLSN